MNEEFGKIQIEMKVVKVIEMVQKEQRNDSNNFEGQSIDFEKKKKKGKGYSGL